MINSLPMSVVYRRYIEALQSGSHLHALRISQLALAAGVDIRNLYMDIFQPAMYDIGKMWETNQITVAQEHVATNITRNVMAQVHALVTTRLTPFRMFMSALKRTVVTTCVSSDLHELGIRMIADFFELEGWRVYHLGAHMPAPDVVRMVNERPAHVLAISVSLNSQLPEMRDLIQMVRASPIGSKIKILVGGQPLNHMPDLYRKIGADFTARNAREAVQQLNGLGYSTLPLLSSSQVQEQL